MKRAVVVKKPRTMKREVWASMTPAVRRSYQRDRGRGLDEAAGGTPALRDSCRGPEDCARCERFFECLWEEI